MANDSPIFRYIPSLPQLFVMLSCIAFGLVLGKWLTFLFDGSTFAGIDSVVSGFSSMMSASSTVVAMKRSLELMPISLAVSCSTYVLVHVAKGRRGAIPIKEIVLGSWRIATLLFAPLGIFFVVSAVFSIIDVSIGLGRNIPFLGVFFSLLYGLIYPVTTLASLIIILFSYFIALGPLHAVAMIEQEKLRDTGGRADAKAISMKDLLHSVQILVVESGSKFRPLLLSGWCFGIIPLFAYQLFLMATIHPASHAEGVGVSFLQNIMLSVSTGVVEAPFVLISLFISFYLVARARSADM